MALGGVLGNGTKVAYSSASPVSWIRVAQVLSVTIPGIEIDEVETTVHSTGGFRTHMPGLKDVTMMELELLADLDPATCPSQAALQTFQAANTTVYWRIEIPVNRAQTSFRPIEFRGFVKDFVPTTEIDDAQRINCTIRFDDTSFSVYAVGAGAIT